MRLLLALLYVIRVSPRHGKYIELIRPRSDWEVASLSVTKPRLGIRKQPTSRKFLHSKSSLQGSSQTQHLISLLTIPVSSIDLNHQKATFKKEKGFHQRCVPSSSSHLSSPSCPLPTLFHSNPANRLLTPSVSPPAAPAAPFTYQPSMPTAKASGSGRKPPATAPPTLSLTAPPANTPNS